MTKTMTEAEKHAARLELRRLISNGESVEDVLANRLSGEERARCLELLAMAPSAARMGVAFDAGEAMLSGWSPQAARNFIMNTAADSQAEYTSAIAVPKVTANGKHTAEQTKAMWRKAMKGNGQALPPSQVASEMAG
ncbi:hypothetical protein [Rhizobium sp. IBUN]|uniref:hypothetical protein n=1 Tax=Rhizobium sp. IBUN TaxID=1042326 RepID=UPI0003F62CA5|nr:hypothetical protein [Rhizobium sp. IBUN]